MTNNHFKFFATPKSLIALDAGPGHRFSKLSEKYPSLEVFLWDVEKSDAENFDTLVSLS